MTPRCDETGAEKLRYETSHSFHNWSLNINVTRDLWLLVSFTAPGAAVVPRRWCHHDNPCTPPPYISGVSVWRFLKIMLPLQWMNGPKMDQNDLIGAKIGDGEAGRQQRWMRSLRNQKRPCCMSPLSMLDWAGWESSDKETWWWITVFIDCRPPRWRAISCLDTDTTWGMGMATWSNKSSVSPCCCWSGAASVSRGDDK